eukprot:CAMPEP_0174890918 /NCGR_PEP_ID=MMETSP0167-20121228/6022_1 /TAXON_ID=38298 /ORGANISM="Rhodella maculata, Strain CCMP736" /LENGTH=113 /DNA_ID=CAMNT_0016128891 /DNA_START=99 /DNA_END=437 /DNA_ORIENTATION=+
MTNLEVLRYNQGAATKLIPDKVKTPYTSLEPNDGRAVELKVQPTGEVRDDSVLGPHALLEADIAVVRRHDGVVGAVPNEAAVLDLAREGKHPASEVHDPGARRAENGVVAEIL